MSRPTSRDPSALLETTANRTTIKVHKKNAASTTAFVTAVIFAAVLAVFTVLSFSEVPLEWDWIDPGYYAFLYTVIGSVGLLTHVVGLFYYIGAKEAEHDSIRGKVNYFIATGLFVLIFVVNLIAAWSFYSQWCPTSPTPGLFECKPPPYYEPPANPGDALLMETSPEFVRQYFRYQQLHLLSAYTLPLILFAIVSLGFSLVNPVVWMISLTVEEADRKNAITVAGKAEEIVMLPKTGSLAYFWGGLFFYATIVVYTGLAFSEVLADVNWLQPWPLILTLTIIGGVGLIAAVITSVIYFVHARKDLQMKKLTGVGQFVASFKEIPLARRIVPHLLFNTLVFAVYVIGGWVFWSKHCLDSEGVAYPECIHPEREGEITTATTTGRGVEAVQIDFVAFEVLNALVGFLFPFTAAVLVHHLMMANERGSRLKDSWTALKSLFQPKNTASKFKPKKKASAENSDD